MTAIYLLSRKAREIKVTATISDKKYELVKLKAPRRKSVSALIDISATVLKIYIA